MSCVAAKALQDAQPAPVALGYLTFACVRYMSIHEKGFQYTHTTLWVRTRRLLSEGGEASCLTKWTRPGGDEGEVESDEESEPEGEAMIPTAAK